MDEPQDRRADDNREAEIRRAIGEVAHELSRPLAAVLNYAELALLDPDLSPAARARLGKVVEHAEACRQVVLHSLELGSATGRVPEPVDLNEVARQAAGSLNLLLGQKGVRLDLALAPQLPTVMGVGRDLQAAVRNLLENAADAATTPRPSAPPEVRLTTEATPAGLRLTVEDSGPGLDPTIADRVFEPFVSTKAAEQGTGLGLAIVRRIARDHEGEVAVAPAPGGGAAFTLTLPAGAESAAPPPPPGHLGPKGALLIDDDAGMRELLAAYLETLGYGSAQAGDGEAGLRAALTGEYDVIICDVKMPTMDGIEFHRRLREASPERARRVIFSTGVLASDPADGELRALPNARLRKPYHLATLKAALAATNGDG